MQNSPKQQRNPKGIPRSDAEGHSFTSFKPLSPENTKGTFSFAKFFQWKTSEPPSPKGSPASVRSSPASHVQTSESVTSSPRTRRLTPIREQQKFPRFQLRRGSSSSSSTVQSWQIPQGYLNLSALLKRLSVVGESSKEDQLPESYFKQYWMPDENCKECYECGEKFNTFRRRHHCRLCGQIFCYRCCNIEIPGEIMGYSGGLRVCTYCNKIFKTYTHSPDMISNLEQLQADIRAVTMETECSVPHSGSMNTLSLPRSGNPFEDDDKFYSQSARKLSSHSNNSDVFEKLEQREVRQSSTMQSTRSPFDAFGVCAAEANILKQGSLRNMWHTIMSSRSGLELQSHRFRLKTYQNCLVSSDLVDWLINHEKALTRTQAVVIGQALLKSGWLEPVPQIRYKHAQDFTDEYALYQPGLMAIKDQASNPCHSLLCSQNSRDEESSDDNSDEEEDDEDDDKFAPQWFRQLPVYESSEELNHQESVKVDPKPPDIVPNAPRTRRISSTKLLDLDVPIGTAEDKNSELSLKVNLDHYEGSESNKGQGADNQGPTLALTTDVPPPPLEHYVYSEGYPISSLRSRKQSGSTAPLLASTNEVLKGAVMAKRVGVNRRKLADTSKLRDDNDERLAMARISEARFLHMVHLVEQLLQDAGLSLDWKDVIMPLVEQISDKVSPDVRNDDDMDIRQYVKFKKIPGGNKSDCQVIWGVGFTKNISNKKMCNFFNNPKILVLCCAIDYQRKENRLATLDSLVLQEREFLKNFVARVAALRPNVLLVEKTVSRLAQDMLLEHGITLALNVKPEVIERVARCTKAMVLRSMEQLSRPQLGTCNSFRVQKYLLKNGEAKTLMFFDGCPPDLGCTVTLRGGNSLVLAKVKKIVQFLTFVSHSQKLETAFLMDEFALPEDPSSYFNRFDSKTDLYYDDNDTLYEDSGDVFEQDDFDDFEDDDFDLANVFQRTLDRTVLSCSPYVEYPLPYLLTSEGSKCAIRSCLPKDIYWSERLGTKRRNTHLTEEELDEFEPPLCKRMSNKSVEMLSSHPLVWSSLVVNPSDQFIQGVVADFRTQGGRIRLKRAAGSNGERRKSKWLLLDMENTKEEKMMEIDGAAERKMLGLATDKAAFQPPVLPASPVHFNKQIDCLDPIHHQRIAVLFSSYSSESNNSPRPCISPWAVFMEFYGRNDITLGGFLERYCFRPSYVCPNPNCDVPMVDHVRYFAHGNGSVYINMKNLESPIPGFHHKILTWSWCKECKQVTPIVPLNGDAWALSFAKYIELRFYADKYLRRATVEPCGHSLHRQHFQYFAYANMVASFKYRPIKLFETAIPPPSILVNDEVRESSYWERDVEALANRGDTVFGFILERLDTFKLEKLDFHTPERESKLHQFTEQLEEDNRRFSEQVQVVSKKVDALQGLQNPGVVSSYDHLDRQDQIALGYVIADSMNGLKRILCEIVENWNNRLQEFVQAEKKRSNKGSATTSPRETKTGDKVDNIAQNLSTKSTEEVSTEDPGTKAQYIFASPGLSPPFSPWSTPENPSPLVPNEDLESTDNLDSDFQATDLHLSNQKNAYLRPINASEGLYATDRNEVIQERECNSEESKADKSASSSVGVDAKPFVRGHRRSISSPPLITVTPCSTSYSSENNELKSSEGVVRSRSDPDLMNMETQSSQKQENPAFVTSGLSNPLISSTPREEMVSSQISEDFKFRRRRHLSVPAYAVSRNPQHENGEADSTDGTPILRRRDKMKNIISSFLPVSYQPIASSFPSHEHHLLPAGEKVLVVVNEKEPSSIIAYALSTKEYNQKLCEIQVTLGRLSKGIKNDISDFEQMNQDQELTESYRGESSMCTEIASLITVHDISEDFVNVEIKDVGTTDEDDLDSNSAHVEIIEDVLEIKSRAKGKKVERMDKVKFSKINQENIATNNYVDESREEQSNAENSCFIEFGFQPKDAGKDFTLDFHIQMQFSYNVCRFYCNAFYAEQFKNLRKHIFEGGEERYIRSLAHCIVWRAHGGKSGSTFSKSLDDRFILKQMSRLELQSFVEFAPHYFQYMNKAITEKRSTLLAKIFGVYRIGFKNSQTNTTMRQDVLVMENLLYHRTIDKTFDLKGSMRSRYVQVSAGENDVLMDENLLEMIREYPIFIRPHSKAVLSKAIHNDTEFLAQHMVMDYSLLVGIDEMQSELVIGIIDFIRTFTWDKKLEMYVKSSGILGGQGKMPTVVSPQLYRTRFTEAMHRYFLMVPDKWTGLGNDLD